MFINIYTIILKFKNFQVGLSALDFEEKYPSNGSLLQQNGIKYCSEPELVLGKPVSDGDRSSSRACSEGMAGIGAGVSSDPEAEGYVNIDHGDRIVRRGGQSGLLASWHVSCHEFCHENMTLPLLLLGIFPFFIASVLLFHLDKIYFTSIILCLASLKICILPSLLKMQDLFV